MRLSVITRGRARRADAPARAAVVRDRACRTDAAGRPAGGHCGASGLFHKTKPVLCAGGCRFGGYRLAEVVDVCVCYCDRGEGYKPYGTVLNLVQPYSCRSTAIF